MAEWQQFLQSVFLGVVFSFLLAKLFSVIFAFNDENIRITLSHQTESESKPEYDDKSPSSSIIVSPSSSIIMSPRFSTAILEENEPLVGGKKGPFKESAVISDHSDSDDDWQGVESTELDETFSAATAFVAATAADHVAQKVSNELQLQLYGLYKIATEGPCSAPQPSALKMTARAKWQAWQQLGAITPEEAMQKYIDIVTELYPSWLAGSANKETDEESSDAHNASSSGPMGPVLSTVTYEEEPGSELKLDAIHTFAREGDEEKLLKCIESGVPLNPKDSEGRTPLHWAVDRGHMNVTALLLRNNADVNAKDNRGQTALHYAAICERAAIAELLVEKGADVQIKDDEGKSPSDLCEFNWPWMHHHLPNAAD